VAAMIFTNEDGHIVVKPNYFECRNLFFEGQPVDKEALINLLKTKKPQQLVQYLSTDALRGLEVNTPAWIDWRESLNDLKTAEALSGTQVDSNISALKASVLKDNTDDLLDSDQVQDLLCEITRNFITNIKREFGDILVAFSNRLISIFEILGYEDPELGVNVMIRDNSYYVCEALINQIGQYTAKTPDVYTMEIKRKERDKKQGRKATFGVSERLQTKIKKVFKDEVVLNPEEAFYIDDDDKEVEDITRELLLSDLVKINQAEATEDTNKNLWTVTSGFRLQKGAAYNTFTFGLKIHKIDENSFDATYFMYLDKHTKNAPKSQLPKDPKPKASRSRKK
jgi:hypothetical protein